MVSGPVFFLVSLAPVIVLFLTIRRLQLGLSDPVRRMSACYAGLVRMPLLILAAPALMTIWMSLESRLDPDFPMRAFGRAEEIELLEYLRFAFDQSARAIAMDILETFRIELTPLRHSCDSFLFCVALILYKGIVSLAGTVWVLSGVAWLSMKIGALRKSIFKKAS